MHAAAERVQVSDAEVVRTVTLWDIEVLPQLKRIPIVLAVFSAGVQVEPTQGSTWLFSRRRRFSYHEPRRPIYISRQIWLYSLQ